jgi:deazaflavin-dependent oxidoreductase (nitroreductase family)
MRGSTEQQSPLTGTGRRGVVQRLHWVKRWMYRGGRPRALARVMNRLSAVQFSAGLLSPGRAMTMEVRGRRTGKTISFPVVVADHEGQRYLVSMLGEDANWVHNVRAAQGKAVLRRHGAQEVRLVEVAAADRAPILRSYLDAAPGARPHIPIDRHAPLQQFERIADRYPVFRIVLAAPATPPGPSVPMNVIAVVLAVVMGILFAIGARGMFRKPIRGREQ